MSFPQPAPPASSPSHSQDQEKDLPPPAARPKAATPEAKTERRFQRRFRRLEDILPGGFGPRLNRLRRPKAWWIRAPLGILLMLGGIFSFLPVLGVWMLPLGLLLLAVDLPFLKPPMARLMVWGERKVQVWRRWWRDRQNS